MTFKFVIPIVTLAPAERQQQAPASSGVRPPRGGTYVPRWRSRDYRHCRDLVIAERFGVQVTEKAAAQAIPAIGAAGGAIVNTIFMDHFQDMARGHFIVRKLERKHGKERVERRYAELPKLG
jgi:hypothetical protein